MNTAETQPPPPPPTPAPAAPNYANLVDRFGAVLIDSIIAAIPAVVLIFMLISSIPLYALLSRDIAPFSASVVLAFFGPWVLYFTYFDGTSGQTIGKKAVGIKVVDEETFAIIGMGRAFARNLLRIIDILPFFYIVGIISVLASGKKQRLGDMAARTVVVKLSPST